MCIRDRTKILLTQPLCTSVTSAVTLRYTPTPKQSSNFEMYMFMLSDPAVPIKKKAASDQDRKVIFVGLNPGRLYNITLRWESVSEGGRPSTAETVLRVGQVTTLERAHTQVSGRGAPVSFRRR